MRPHHSFVVRFCICPSFACSLSPSLFPSLPSICRCPHQWRYRHLSDHFCRCFHCPSRRSGTGYFTHTAAARNSNSWLDSCCSWISVAGYQLGKDLLPVTYFQRTDLHTKTYSFERRAPVPSPPPNPTQPGQPRPGQTNSRPKEGWLVLQQACDSLLVLIPRL